MLNQECGDRPVGEVRAELNLHAMKVVSSVPWPPWLMWRDTPASISHGVTLLTVLVALTLIFVGMMASNGRVNVPSSAPSSISDSGRQYLNDLSRRVSETEQHNMFLSTTCFWAAFSDSKYICRRGKYRMHHLVQQIMFQGLESRLSR